MRTFLLRSLVFLAAILMLSFGVRAQDYEGPGGQRVRRGAPTEPSPTANLPFDPHDLSGVWKGLQNRNTLSRTPPPMTPWAQARYNAAKPGIGPRAQPLGNDPIMVCDPIGYPRIAFYNDYPMEIVATKDRLIEFFDFFYVHRTIWMDGRSLPQNPEPTWYGYSVGHWD